MTMKKIINECLLVAVVLSLGCGVSGCSHMLDTLDLHDETVLPASLPIDNPPPRKTNGTIFQSGYEVSLYQDHIAGRIGDILTVRLEEATQGEKQAKMKTTKTDTINTNKGTGAQPIMADARIFPGIFDLGSSMEFDGKGDTNEYNKLHGTISVTVKSVLSNGNMAVQGESWITINQGREYIRLTGIVRSEDIEPGNVISSQRLADARISYTGSGQVGNSARGGLLTQLMNKFFPF